MAKWIGWLGNVWGFRVVSLRPALPRLGGTCERGLLGQIGGGDTWIGLVKLFVVMNFINHVFLY